MYLVPQDLRAKPQIIKGINIIDFLIVIGVAITGYVLTEQAHMVVSPLRIPFNIFNVIVAIYLILPSPWNKGKKNWQSIQYAFTRDKYTYHSIDEVKTSAKNLMDAEIIEDELDRAELLAQYYDNLEKTRYQ